MSSAEPQLPRVLYVDDEQNILLAVRRQQRKHLDLTTCSSPAEALELLRQDQSFGVIVSDFDMPGMDGIAFLQEAREIVPDTTRIMLTGKADLNAATRAVNDGHVFRFLTKPCDSDLFRESVYAGARIHELVTAERSLLERTLRGAIDILTQTLSLSNPEAFGRASRLRRYVEVLARRLGVENLWEYSVAAMMSQLGCIAIPPDVVRRSNRGEELSDEDRRMLAEHPMTAAKMLRSIPRMETIADMVELQEADFDAKNDGTEPPPLGARLLRIAIDYDASRNRGLAGPEAIRALRDAPAGVYDPDILPDLDELCRVEGFHNESVLPISQLRVGMIVVDPVMTLDGLLVVAAGHEVTESLLLRLQNWARSKIHHVQEPIRVLVPEL